MHRPTYEHLDAGTGVVMGAGHLHVADFSAVWFIRVLSFWGFLRKQNDISKVLLYPLEDLSGGITLGCILVAQSLAHADLCKAPVFGFCELDMRAQHRLLNRPAHATTLKSKGHRSGPSEALYGKPHDISASDLEPIQLPPVLKVQLQIKFPT